MKKQLLLLVQLLIISLLFTNYAYAVGGQGATCNPSTPTWGNCALAPVPFAASVTNTINIPAGHYAEPFSAAGANTEYILQGDMTADGTAILINASYVIINLNGYTITYNQTVAGAGVAPGSYNRNHVSVRNGSIIQGAAMSEGDSYGSGNNPIDRKQTADSAARSFEILHIANLYLKYGGRDVGGINARYSSNAIIEQNTIEDTYEFGTLKNRHHGIRAITISNTTGPIVRNNTIINARQNGIVGGGGGLIHGNHIGIRSISTNSAGIGAGGGTVIHNNTIIGRGEHPIGIFEGSGVLNVTVYNNYIDVKTTALGDEYSSAYLANPNNTILGNYAVGFRTTWGADNMRVYDNEFVLSSDSNYTGTYSPTGATAYIKAGARGLMIAINAGQTVIFENNIITTLDKDGTGEAFGIACTGGNQSDGLFFLNNTVTSNIANIVVADAYGSCAGFPLFQGNTLIKADNYPAYNTIGSYLGGYFDATARFVDNIYRNGAAEDSITLHPRNTRSITDVYFGAVVDGGVRYRYRLHDNNNTSSVLIRDDYDPMISMSYRLPGSSRDEPTSELSPRDEPTSELSPRDEPTSELSPPSSLTILSH